MCIKVSTGMTLTINCDHGEFFRIKQMEESGILLRYEKTYWPPDKCREKRLQASKTRALTVTDVLLVFIILGLGITTATLSLAVEIYFKTFVHNRHIMPVNLFNDQRSAVRSPGKKRIPS